MVSLFCDVKWAYHFYMKAEIITIGDELLIGQVVDTNSAWIGEHLNEIGVELSRINSIADTSEAITAMLDEASARADVLILTGGLGPTKDDITKYTLCEYFDDVLVPNELVLEQIKKLFAKFGRKELSSLNIKQAELPSRCTVLQNDLGTAAGMWFEKNNTIYVSMPGVPYEMKHIMEARVLPELVKRFDLPAIYHKTLQTFGIPESDLAIKIEDWEDALPSYISLAFLPSPGLVRLRLSARGKDKQALISEVDRLFSILIDKYMQSVVHTFEERPIEVLVGKLLQDTGRSVASAESCTGGFLAHLITSVPGSSAYYNGSVIAYANEVKEKVLGVKMEDLQNYGAVSETVVRAMAEGVKELMGTDFGLASSGIAGPDGGTKEKPVGTIWLAIAGPDGTETIKLSLGDNRMFNIRYSANQLLRSLYLIMTSKNRVK